MSAYKITASPLLHSSGPFRGKLKGVSFIAASTTDSREWFCNNCGQFELAFSKVMPLRTAQAIVHHLMRGEDIELPGVYEETQFLHGFLFDWEAAYPALTHAPEYSFC